MLNLRNNLRVFSSGLVPFLKKNKFNLELGLPIKYNIDRDTNKKENVKILSNVDPNIAHNPYLLL